MAASSDIPDARAVAGVEPAGRRHWLYSDALLISGRVEQAQSSRCACCLSGVEKGKGIAYCAACRRHQRWYLLGLLLAAAAALGLGREASDWSFALLPFAGPILHGILVFLITALPALLATLFLTMRPADPVHGSWSKAVRHVGAAESAATVYTNPQYGADVLEALGRPAHRELREPRSGWSSLLILALLVPGAFAGAAAYGLDAHFITIYVDNAGAEDVAIETSSGHSIGTAKAGRATALQVPKMAMTLIASAGSKGELERITVGGLEEILGDRYPALFPDIEYDVAEQFIWNLLRAQCYQTSTHMYGSIGFGGGSEKVHRERAFYSDAEKPFENAPSAIESPLPFGSRRELLRAPCPK